MNQQGFQQLGAPASGGLAQGQTWNVPVDLSVGYEYSLVGVCDRGQRHGGHQDQDS